MDVKIGCTGSQKLSLNFYALCTLYRSGIGVSLPETPFDGPHKVEKKIERFEGNQIFEGFRVYYPQNSQFGAFQLKGEIDLHNICIAKLSFPPKLSLKWSRKSSNEKQKT